jgi:hypothetical protein
MKRDVLLTADGVINLVLGILLIVFPGWLVAFLGIPEGSRFYANILGGVLLGIGIALFLERGARGWRGSGLGLDGAVVINLCGGLVLAGWLIFGDLALSLPGTLFLWFLVFLLVGLSSAEIAARIRAAPKD